MDYHLLVQLRFLKCMKKSVCCISEGSSGVFTFAPEIKLKSEKFVTDKSNQNANKFGSIMRLGNYRENKSI